MMLRTCWVCLLGIACLAAVPAGAQTLYEEEPTASMNIRVQLWRQLASYADSLQTLG